MDLGQRIQQCGYHPEVRAQTGREIRRTIADLFRHVGYYEKAESLAQEEVHAARATQASSYDDQAQADAIHAASLYDPHRFAEMEKLLEPWLEKLTRDPMLVSPEARVMVFNTLARARVILGRGEWVELFRLSEQIQLEREPMDLARTWNYLAHGLLRHGRLDEAETVLLQVERRPGMSDFSRWINHFLRAEYHRLRGERLVSVEMEAWRSDNKHAGHPFGFYFQATARQPGRDQPDAVQRFEQARKLFLQDAGPRDHPNILHFLADCISLGQAGWSNDAALWGEARQALSGHLAPRAGCQLAEYYSGVWKALSDHPDREAAEAFLRRVPFF